MNKIAIIGFGAAGIGAIKALKDNKNNEIHIFEKSKDIFSSSISGIRSDGKLFVSENMGGDIKIDKKLQKDFVDYYLNGINKDDIGKGYSFNNEKYYNKFYQKGFEPITADFYHIGTDQLANVLQKIYKEFDQCNNIHFHFNCTITNLYENDEFCSLFYKKDKETVSMTFDNIIVGVGRSGHKLINTLIKNNDNNIILENSKVDIGIRYEVPNHIVKDLNKEMYEFKIHYKSKTGYIVRSFCNNPSGFVTTENYENEFTTVNGHAKSKEKSENTNFAILTSVKFTEPFNDSIAYLTNIAKLTNLLSDKKATLQTYGNFKKCKRTKHLYRVKPTLKENDFILGDINLAFPRRVVESIIDFIENLNDIVPGISNPDNLCYAPELKFYSNKLNNNYFNKIKFVGDCSGHTRSIIIATCHGYKIGKEIEGELI